MPKTVSNSSIAWEHDFICKRGDTFWAGFEFYTDDAFTVPLDISASSFAMDVIISKDKKPVMTFAMGAGFTITALNVLELDKTKTQMLIPAGNYRYDIEKTPAGGKAVTIFRGLFIVEDDITPP